MEKSKALTAKGFYAEGNYYLAWQAMQPQRHPLCCGAEENLLRSAHHLQTDLLISRRGAPRLAPQTAVLSCTEC